MNDRRILIVAAHPDDEVLGCGGTLARHTAEGDIVQILFLADGVGGRGQIAGAETVRDRIQAACNAAATLGAGQPIFFGWPDNRLDSMALLDMVQPLEQVIEEFKPSTIYTHHGGDLNVDHRLAHQAVLTACRPQPEGFVTRILTFETPSSTEWSSASIGVPFCPNWFVNISTVIDQKMAALHCYEEELRPFPHARSPEGIEALARLRGSSCGVQAAEAFMLIREIVK